MYIYNYLLPQGASKQKNGADCGVFVCKVRTGVVIDNTD